MVKIHKVNELLMMAHDFMNDCATAARAHLISDREVAVEKDLFDIIHNMMLSVNLTSDSILLLLSKKRTWDASVLLRTVIEGSAKLCYMLAASSKKEEMRRLDEFKKLLPKKEMGSLEQPIARVVRGAFYRKPKDICLDPLKKIVDKWKTQGGDGVHIRETCKKWEFWNITKVLRNECSLWAEMADWWEYRYAMSNSLVHKTDTGCGEIAEREDRNIEYKEISDISHAVGLLTDTCMLWYTRFAVMVRRIKGNEVSLRDVLMKNRCIFDSAEEIQQAFETVCHKYEFELKQRG